jgi:hypothetical protein
MVRDNMKSQMRILRLVAMISIVVGLGFLIAQIVHDKESVDMRMILPFLFAGWVGDYAYRVMSVLSDRITSLEEQSGA